jgi:hypothetical protein
MVLLSMAAPACGGDDSAGAGGGGSSATTTVSVSSGAGGSGGGGSGGGGSGGEGDAPTCDDGAMNGAETGVDCGGPDCDPCVPECEGGDDCESGVCEGSECQDPTCDDGVANGGETDVDCGGGVCAACSDGSACDDAADCASGVCDAGACATATYDDGVQNGGETDVDCGGGVCAACSDGAACDDAADCASGVCDAGACATAACDDWVQNGGETDVDCGGGVCAPCAAGLGCVVDGDCALDLCLDATCAACMPGEVLACFSGPPASLGLGACAAGTQSCGEAGQPEGACVGEVLPTAEDCASGADESCDGSSGCDGAALWGAAFGDALDQAAAAAVAVDVAGSSYVGGSFAGTTSFGAAPLTSAGGRDAFLVKLDADGGTLWSLRAGGEGQDAITTVGVAPDGDVIVAGTFEGTLDLGGAPLVSLAAGDAFVARLSSAGQVLWSARLGGPDNQRPAALAVDAGGDVLVYGDFAGSITIGADTWSAAGSKDLFVARLSGDGQPTWSAQLGSSALEVASGLALDPGSGAMLLTGRFTGFTNLGGAAFTSNGMADAFVVKLASDGSHVWSFAYGDSSYQEGSAIAVAPDGSLLVGGGVSGSIDFGGGPLTAAGSTDAFVAKLAPDGAHVWSRLYGDAAFQQTSGLAVDELGQITLMVGFNGAIDVGTGPIASNGLNDVLLAKLDPAGAPLWARGVGGSGDELAVSLALDAGGGLRFAGSFSGAGDFGGQAFASAGGTDVMVARYAP